MEFGIGEKLIKLFKIILYFNYKKKEYNLL